MRANVTLVLSLLAILLINWLDVRYFGITNPHRYSVNINQSAHFIALLATGAIGFLNWKNYSEKWLKTLWLTLYADVVILLGVLAFMYIAFNAGRGEKWISILLNIRNIFIGPVPFLAFYLLSKVKRQAE
jgi:hypothetical protein